MLVVLTVGEFRVFKGRNYCDTCVEVVQKTEVGQRKDQYGNVVAEEHRVAQQNQRVANAPKVSLTKMHLHRLVFLVVFW